MPNFRINSGIRGDIVSAAITLTGRVEAYGMAGFPLTLEQVQDVIMHPQVSAQLRALTTIHNVKTIERHNRTRVYFPRAALPGLTRGLSVMLVLPEPLFVPRATWHKTYHEDAAPDDRYALRFDPGFLAPEAVEALVKWGNHAVRQHRLAKMSLMTVRDIMENYASTTAHLRAIWPFLGTLVPDPHWREKYNVPTRNLSIYTPSPAVWIKYQKRIEVAEMVLAQGQLLTPFKSDEKKVTADLEWWERMGLDVRY